MVLQALRSVREDDVRFVAPVFGSAIGPTLPIEILAE